MGISGKTLISLGLFLFVLDVTLGHPQCLDFRAPFQPSSPLSFCSQYSDFGCCSNSSDDRLQGEYEYIRSNVSPSDWDQCNGYVKDILCLKCSPYAAHLFDAEASGKPRKFPGLCTEYCHGVFDKCHQLVWFFDSSLATLTVLGSRRRFCNRVSLDDTDYCYPDLLENPALKQGLSPDVKMSSAFDCLCLERVKDNLANPLFARPAGDGTGRVFVAEQRGKVYIYDAKANEWKDDLFLDFTDKTYVTAWPGDERGFLGMAFHPNFSSNGRFFVFYVLKKESGDVLPPELEHFSYKFESKARVSEMRVDANNPNKADPNYEKVILELFQPFLNHNGGEMLFGIDGYLYTFHGDGGGAGDPLAAGQNKSLLHGKVLRLDVDSDPTKPYTIPPDNPFIGESESRPEIYAYGVRNIWRCGFDRGDRETGESRGRVLCGDVGQSKYEEIDVLRKGANYGWNSREGLECYNNNLCGNVGPEELPIHAYNHSVGKSVTGGVFYRGCQNPNLNGHYVYGDYTSRRLFSLSNSDGVWTNKDISLCNDDLCQGHFENDVGGKILSFGEDEDGEIYILTSPGPSSAKPNGKMFKFVDPLTRSDPSLCQNGADSNRVPLPRHHRIVTTDLTGKKKSPNIRIIKAVRLMRKRKFRRRRRNRMKRKCRRMKGKRRKRCRRRLRRNRLRPRS